MPATNEEVTKLALKTAVENQSMILALMSELQSLGVAINVDRIKILANEHATYTLKEMQVALNK